MLNQIRTLEINLNNFTQQSSTLFTDCPTVTQNGLLYDVCKSWNLPPPFFVETDEDILSYQGFCFQCLFMDSYLILYNDYQLVLFGDLFFHNYNRYGEYYFLADENGNPHPDTPKHDEALTVSNLLSSLLYDGTSEIVMIKKSAYLSAMLLSIAVELLDSATRTPPPPPRKETRAIAHTFYYYDCPYCNISITSSPDQFSPMDTYIKECPKCGLDFDLITE